MSSFQGVFVKHLRGINWRKFSLKTGIMSFVRKVLWLYQ